MSRRSRVAPRRARHASLPRRTPRRYLWGAVVVAVGLARGVAWWASSRAGAPAGADLGDRVPNEGFDHVPVGTAIQYRAHPPASGPHYPTPAPAGVYPEGLPPGFWVHSLEHGYIVLLYRPPVAPAVLDRFQEMVRRFPASKFGNVKLVVAPYAGLPHPFAVVAWNWRLWMDAFDPDAVLRFYRSHVDQGREDVP